MKILLHGAGTEARAATSYFAAQKEGAELLLFDDGGQSLNGAAAVSQEQARVALSTHRYLRSPGVPPSHPLYQYTERQGRPTTPTGFWIESLAPAGTITVTGTKGKSTTTTLLASILTEVGLSAAAYGNIGKPPLSTDIPQEDHPVLEASSYMMHDLPLRGHLHVLTNLFKEHTDWHGGETAYRAAKLRPFREKPDAPGVAPRSVIDAENLTGSLRAIEDLAHLTDGQLIVGDQKADLGAPEAGFRSGPLRLALQAASAAALHFVEAPSIARAAERAIASFKGLPARQEIVPSTDGRIWVNDALATIPEAVIAVLDRFAAKDVFLILGGKDRGQNVDILAQRLRDGLAQAAVFGPIAPKYGDAAQRVDTLEEAIDWAAERAPKDAVILFSPGAPSSAPHADYQERSEIFKGRAAAAR